MVDLPGMVRRPEERSRLALTGRARLLTETVANPSGPITGWLPLIVNTGDSRFHGASIAGLLVGAMGVLVFALCLRTFVRERRQDGREGARQARDSRGRMG